MSGSTDGILAGATCYLERSEVRQILIGQPDDNLHITELVLAAIDALPILSADDIAARRPSAPDVMALLTDIRKCVKNARGAVESGQVTDKDVHGSLTRVIAMIDSALSADRTKADNEIHQSVRGPSEPLQCLRCGTVDAFGPVSADRTIGELGREEIARVIDPDAFEEDDLGCYRFVEYLPRRAAANRKADAILSLSPTATQPVGQADHPDCPCKPGRCIYPTCTCPLPNQPSGSISVEGASDSDWDGDKHEDLKLRTQS